ncbi:peptidase [Streptococcus oricebi]|uniref:Peptidase n=1 Tax=Streptococcus oricebi TaxID=1547447 RepID=A0ABS5B0N2_9STRE|nr:peptidase [Streptococcus oricebi]
MGLVLTVLTFSLLYIFELSLLPKQEGQAEALEIARKYTDLEDLEQFAFYNGKASYYSLLGQSKTKEPLAVLIDRESGKIYSYQLSQGISQKEAEKLAREQGAGEIDKTTFGYLDGQPIWEVKSKAAYYNISFKQKTMVSKEGL